MQKTRKILSVILCISLFVACFATMPAKAVEYPMMGEISSTNGEAKIYSMAGTTGHEAKPEDKNKSKHLTTLKNGTQVKVLGEEIDGDGDKWYKINYGTDFKETGYAVINKVVLKYEYVTDEDFETNLKNFPESYHEALRALHAKYPNWQFVANPFKLTFKTAVEAQYSVNNVKDTRKWVEYNYFGEEWIDPRAKDLADPEPRWTYASRAAIEYYMDPRNSLNEDMIFAFMQQSYKADDKTQENLRTIIKGTFLENGYDKDGNGKIEGDADKNAYIADLIDAAKESGVSPYVLAATIIVEQGTKGESNLISGRYPGFEGFYNFFNYAASGSTNAEITKSGLEYAKKWQWNSRSAAIIGGAKKYADGYINVGQDTYYYKDFNIVKEDWTHQYAAALYDAWTNAKYLQKGCVTNTDATIVFSIPIYADMPENPCPIPTAANPGVTPNPTPDPTPDPPSTPSAPSTPKPAIKMGDINKDGVIDIFDLGDVKMHCLKIKTLQGDAFTAGDINKDGVIDVFDLGDIKMDILKIKTIA